MCVQHRSRQNPAGLSEKADMDTDEDDDSSDEANEPREKIYQEDFNYLKKSFLNVPNN